jgi:hypothetical protein
MAQHKWHKEIKAWADGAEIEVKWFEDRGSDKWHKTENPAWNTRDSEYRIKPQPKEPQYLYVYKGSIGHEPIFCFARSGDRLVEQNYIGKIKLEDDDNGND